jgi:hypothetical protein
MPYRPERFFCSSGVLSSFGIEIIPLVQPLDMVDNSNRFCERISVGFYPIRLYR